MINTLIHNTLGDPGIYADRLMSQIEKDTA